MDATAIVTKPKSLLDLPIEIRLKIYGYALISNKEIHLSATRTARYDWSPYEPSPQTKPQVALLRTCKEINREATPILYGKNKFEIQFSWQYEAEFSFLRNLRAGTVNHIDNLCYHLEGRWDSEPVYISLRDIHDYMPLFRGRTFLKAIVLNHLEMCYLGTIDHRVGFPPSNDLWCGWHFVEKEDVEFFDALNKSFGQKIIM